MEEKLDITVVPMDRTKFWPGNTCYALYKVYPGELRWLIGHFRSPYDYEAEAEWLESHEKEPAPVRYEACEVSDWKLDGICDSAKYAEKLERIVREKWEICKRSEQEYNDWKTDLVAKGFSESDLPLSKRRCPPLLAEPSLVDMYYSCIRDNDGLEPKWESERRRLHELVSKARESEPDDWCVKPLPVYEPIYFHLRYMYDGEPLKTTQFRFGRK